MFEIAASLRLSYQNVGDCGQCASISTELYFYFIADGSYYDANPYFNSMTAKADDFRKRPWQTVKGLPELEYAFWTVGHNSLGDSVNSDRVVSQVMPYTSQYPRSLFFHRDCLLTELSFKFVHHSFKFLY